MSDVKSVEGSDPGAPYRRPRRAVVRRRLLDAAIRVFAARGYAGASLDEVAVAAGLTKGAIYSNFSGKDDLFFAMLADQVAQRADAIRAALLGNGGLQGASALREIGRQLTAAFTAQRDWQLVFFDFWRRSVQDEAVRTQFVAHRKVMRATIAECVEEIAGATPAGGAFTVDEVVTLVLAMCNGLALEYYIDPEFVGADLLGHVLARLAGEE